MLKLLTDIKDKVDLKQRDNLAIVILGGVVLLMTAVVISAEAFTPERSAGYMTIFGWRLELDWKRKDFNSVLMVCAALGAVLCVVAAFWKNESERFKKIVFVVLLTLVTLSTVSVTLKYGFIRYQYFDAGDAFSYFLGPKYFTELGYDVHYECVAAAQVETGSRMAKRGRDLRTNTMKPIRELASRERREMCRSRFTDARWESFKKDVDLFRSWHGGDGWKRRFRDHGYNGTPVYQALAGFLANAFELNHTNMVLFALLNLWMVYVMFAVVIRAFGWRMGLLFALFFFDNFLERWLLGGAYLRYEWITAVIIGVSFIKMNRYALAGGCFAFAAGVKIFPVFLFAGMGVAIIWDLVEKRGLRPEFKRFLKGAAIAGAALVIISVIHGHGFQNWGEFLHQMDLNSGRYTMMRTGFVYNFIWPKEIWLSDPNLPWGSRVAAMSEPFFLFLTPRHIRWILTGLFFYFVLKHIRKMDDITRTVLVGFMMFFLFFGTVRYYYSGLMGLPLMWHAAMEKKSGNLFFAYLLLISSLGYVLQENTAYAFVYNTFYPMAFTAYIIAYIVFREIRERSAAL